MLYLPSLTKSQLVLYTSNMIAQSVFLGSIADRSRKLCGIRGGTIDSGWTKRVESALKGNKRGGNLQWKH